MLLCEGLSAWILNVVTLSTIKYLNHVQQVEGVQQVSAWVVLRILASERTGLVLVIACTSEFVF